MEPNEIKKVVAQTEKEHREKDKQKQIDNIKEIVTRSLKKIESLEKDKQGLRDKIKEVDGKIKYVKMDLEDMKNGKLSKIVERQEKDPEAKKNSVVIIIKEKEIIREREVYPTVPLSPWYQPFRFIWSDDGTWNKSQFYCTGNDDITVSNATGDCTFLNDASTINCSVAKDASIGAYDIDGKIIHLR